MRDKIATFIARKLKHGGKVMGCVEYIMSSMKVKLEGNPAVRLTDTVKINDGNTVGMNAAPSQTKVMVMN